MQTVSLLNKNPKFGPRIYFRKYPKAVNFFCGCTGEADRILGT
jgi:hypothetical protein